MNQIEEDLKAELEMTPTAPTAEELAEKVNEELAKEHADDETPVEEPAEETPAEPVEEPKPAEEPATEEPATEEPVAEEEPVEETPKELILGKFKSVEDLQNAYTNLEKQYSKKSQQVSEVAKISEPSEFDNMVNQEISKAGWDLVNKAMQTITDPEQLKEATFALEQYKRTGDGSLLEKARGFLSPRIDRQLEVDFMNASAAIKQEANRYRDEIELQPVRESLEALEKEDPDWLNEKTHQDILVEAIKLNRKVNVREIKNLIKTVEEKAVERYKAKERKQQVKKEEKVSTVSVKAPERVDPPAPKKEWYNMSIEEQLREEMKEL